MKISNEKLKQIKERKIELMKFGMPGDLIPVVIFMEVLNETNKPTQQHERISSLSSVRGDGNQS